MEKINFLSKINLGLATVLILILLCASNSYGKTQPFKAGDIVQITSSRPISKMKRWRLFKIHENNDNIPVSSNKDDAKWYNRRQD